MPIGLTEVVAEFCNLAPVYCPKLAMSESEKERLKWTT
jgi:hypothetical protein